MGGSQKLSFLEQLSFFGPVQQVVNLRLPVLEALTASK